MNTFLDHVIHTLTTNLTGIGIQAIVLRGSQQTKDEVDLRSDIDLLVVLQPEARMDAEALIQGVHQTGTVFGDELYSSPESVLFRAAIYHDSSVELLDIGLCSHAHWLSNESSSKQTVVHGDIDTDQGRVKQPTGDSSPHMDETQIQATWFKYIATVKKFCRNDYLIGMHLLLDLIREYLVLEMIERDFRCGTNVHRFGYSEKLPDEIKLSNVDETNLNGVLDYIATLANAYDQKLSSLVAGYTSRYRMVSEFAERSKTCLKN